MQKYSVFRKVILSWLIDQVNPGESCNMLLLPLIKSTTTIMQNRLEKNEKCKPREIDGVKQGADQF